MEMIIKFYGTMKTQQTFRVAKKCALHWLRKATTPRQFNIDVPNTNTAKKPMFGVKNKQQRKEQIGLKKKLKELHGAKSTSKMFTFNDY
jgi:hypothetical protein